MTPITKEITVTSNDEEIMNIMLESRTVEEWNSNRDKVKDVRTNDWITKNIDSNGIINKSKIPQDGRKSN